MAPESENQRAAVIPLHAAQASGQDLESAADDDLMLLARGGLRAAFDVLMHRHQVAVLRFASRQLGSSEAARDVAQSTFFELYRYLPRYEPRGMLRALVFRIALNQCRIVKRGTGRAAIAMDRLSQFPGNATDLPSKGLLEKERLRQLNSAIARLGQKQREVVTLRFGGGLSHQEIAEALSIPVGTVKSRLFNGLAKLHAKLEGEL